MARHPVMRPVLLAGAAGVLLLAGCGGGGRAAAPATPVRLTVSAPGDLAAVRDGSVEVRGSVRPAGAAVSVAGQRAQVSGGTFTARVGLDAGVNVIDVLASAGDARPALTAIRVRRITTVPVPDVTSLSSDEARTQLQGVGLKVDTQRTGGFFDPLLGGKLGVCRTEPPAGAQVDVGTTVTVDVAHRC
jgi:hypothetical protein